MSSAWQGGVIANGVADLADFSTRNSGATAARVVDLDTDVILGALILGDVTATNRARWRIESTSGNGFRFDNDGADARIVFGPGSTGGGTSIVGLPVILIDSLNLEVGTSVFGTLSGSISAGTPGIKVITNHGAGSANTAGGILTGSGTMILSADLSDGIGVISVVQNSATSPLTLSGTNTYSGGTTIRAGFITINSDSRLGASSSPVTLEGGTLLAATDSGAFTINRQVILNGGGGLRVNTGSVLTFAGVISGEGPLGFGTDGGLGVAILTADNTYTGDTTITRGTVQVDGSLASANVIVNGSSAVLSGTGEIHGNVTIQNGSLRPGAALGLLTVGGNLTLAPTSSTTFEINGSARGTTYDALDIGGVFTAGGDLNVQWGILPVTGTYLLADFGSASLEPFDFNSVTITGQVSLTLNSLGNGSWSAAEGGNEFLLTISPSQLTLDVVANAEPPAYPAALPVSAGLSLYLDGEDVEAGDNRVTRWTDRSGRGNHALAPDSEVGTSPELVAGTLGSGHNVLRFDGIGDHLDIAANPAAFDGRAKTTVVLFRPSSVAAGRLVTLGYGAIKPADPSALPVYRTHNLFLSTVGGGSLRALNRAADEATVIASTDANSVPTGTYLVAVNRCATDGATLAVIRNAAGTRSTASASGADADPRDHRLGRIGADAAYRSPAPENFFQGDIAAVLIYNRALSDAELIQVEAFLFEHYLAGDDHPTTPDAFSRWIATFDLPPNLTGPDMDAAGDGISNLAKYAFGMLPLETAPDRLPSLQLMQDAGGQRARYTIHRNPDATEIKSVVEFSTDLIQWSETSVGFEIIEDTAERLIVLGPYLDGGAEAAFFRTRVTNAPPVVRGTVHLDIPLDGLRPGVMSSHSGTIGLQAELTTANVQVRLLDGAGATLFETHLTHVPAGSTTVPFSLPSRTTTPGETLTLQVHLLDAPAAHDGIAQWRPGDVRLNRSGKSPAIPLDTLVEVTFASSSLHGADGAPLDINVVFTPPTGSALQEPAKAVDRPGARDHWVARRAVDQPGAWSYTVQGTDGSTGGPVALFTGAFTVQAPNVPPPASPAARPPFPRQVTYNNDTTNVLQFYNQNPSVASLLRESVDEIAGTSVQAHFISPAYTWVPWWRSTFYPMHEHMDWFRHLLGPGMTEQLASHVRNGGDIIDTIFSQAIVRGQAPYVSVRLNDHHYLDLIGPTLSSRALRHRSRFYHENPEFTLGPDKDDSAQRVLNWLHPQVRAHSLGLIHEIITGYDPEGLELDFLRHASFFPDGTTNATRRQIMLEFVQRVRAMLDANTPPGSYRWLGVRVPAYLSAHAALGIDLPAMATEGIDFVNLSISFQTHQQSDFAAIKQALPHTAVLLEMAHTASSDFTRTDLGWTSATRALTTDEHFYTAAHLAYRRGLQGVSLFNFVYFREDGLPYHALDRLDDPAWLATQPQLYVIAQIPSATGRFGWTGLRNLPALAPGASATFDMEMSPPTGGWTADGRLRALVYQRDPASQWQARLNGVILEPVADVSPHYDTPYPDYVGVPQEYLAWRVPANVPYDGVNQLTLTLLSGPSRPLYHIDLGIR